MLVEVDADLREIDFGAFDGRTFASIEREHPELYTTWMQTPTTVAFPEGETWTSLRERAHAALERTAEIGDGRSTIVVTHLGVILAPLGRALSVADEDVFRMTVSHAGTFVVDITGGAWVASQDDRNSAVEVGLECNPWRIEPRIEASERGVDASERGVHTYIESIKLRAE